MTEKEMRSKILAMVKDYCNEFHNQNKEFNEGDRIPYASRVYDAEELTNLVDSSLDFWLTAGRYVEEFEKSFAKYLNVKFCSVVNSGSSANLIAFMALTSPLLGERKINRGDEVITVAAAFLHLIQTSSSTVLFLAISVLKYGTGTMRLSVRKKQTGSSPSSISRTENSGSSRPTSSVTGT